MSDEEKMWTVFMKKSFIILTWAGFTFASHYYAKIFLSGSSHFSIDALILTSVQMLLASQVLLGSSEVKLAFYIIVHIIVNCLFLDVTRHYILTRRLCSWELVTPMGP